MATQLKQPRQPTNVRKVNTISDLIRKVAIQGLVSEREKGWLIGYINLPFLQTGCEKVRYKKFHAVPMQ